MSTESVTKSLRIRRDLWNAVLDYSSGKVYVWDGSEARALDAGESAPSGKKVPTVTAAEYQEWKKRFVESRPESQKAKVDAWASENLPTIALPPNVRGAWNAELKQRVLSALRNWFDTTGQPLPEDFTYELVPPHAPRALDDASERLERVRRAIITCIKQMTWEELSDLKIPATMLAHLEVPLRDSARLGSLHPQGQGPDSITSERPTKGLRPKRY